MFPFQQSKEDLNVPVPGNGSATSQQFQSFAEPHVVEIPITNDATSRCQSHINIKMSNADDYAPYILDIYNEKGKLEAPKCAVSLKAEDCLSKILQREINSQLGGKLMQILTNNSIELPKFAPRDKSVSEKTYDTLTNRLRKYKRSASFNSRRVVLLFSILSIIGTIILIYLTLRVRQIGDGVYNA